MRIGRARAGAAVVAGAAWLGLALLLSDQAERTGGNVAAALWANARFFTDLSNLLIAVVFSALVVIPRSVPRRLLGMPLVSTLMASAVYYCLLGGWHALGANGAGDVLAHAIVPALVVGWWLLAPTQPAFRRRDVIVWAAFPIGYCLYAIARGRADGRYPYFFLDVTRLGSAVLLYVAAILVLFGVIGLLVVAVDRRLGRSA